MSEEEVIEYFEEVINWHRKNTPDRVYALNNKDIEMIQGLLDLFNKEKEKNKTLETLLQGNLYELYLYYKELASKYQGNSISKDKIRAKIKKLREEPCYAECAEAVFEEVEILEELLKE